MLIVGGLAAVIAGQQAVSLRADEAANLAFFETRIRPVLVRECYACHSAEAARDGKLKGGLQLDSRAGIEQGGETGVLAVSGKPDDSLLIQSLRYHEGGVQMPPRGKLPEAVIADFEEWVRRGLPDPRTQAVASVRRGMSIEEGRTWWSLIPPHRHGPPPVRDTDWPRTLVDQFLLARLEEQGMRPQRDAERATLLRRVTLDLTGLPPDPAAIDAFLQAPTEGEAFAAVVDELLASEQFGERWGRHWLDLARYADSNGRDRNVLWYHARHYRNGVIAAWNADLPYDQFIREQIAGDLMPTESSRETDRRTVATGFLALGPKAFEELKPEVFRMDVIDEQIDVIGRAILGLSLACARCHDHKFDPIPTRDYYALAGIFRSTQPLYGHGPRGIKATAHHHTPLIAIGPDAPMRGPAGLAYFERLNELNLKQNTARSDRYRVVRQVADVENQMKRPDADLTALQTRLEMLKGEIQNWDQVVRAAETEFQTAMDAAPPQPDWAMGARDRASCEDCRIHVRGETAHLGDLVPRGGLQVLPNPFEVIPTSQSGRIQLARWLTARDNPLTARVHVNRVWAHLFGRGLVSTLDDFGVNGARPSHPELLDDLSVRFMESGWSTKWLIRELVLSRAYRMSSDPDPENLRRDPDHVWVWRMAPRRLDAESLRDAILSVSGELDLCPPDAHQEYLAARHPYRDAEYFNFKPPFLATDIESRHRSVYLPVVRGVLPALFPLFDFAAPDRPVAQRDVSTVPAQALFLMNSPWVLTQSRRAARRLLDDSDAQDSDRVQILFRRALGRQATSEELTAALAYVAGPEGQEGDSSTAAPEPRENRWSELCQIVLASAEFRMVR